jgi:polyphosphate kinase
VVRVHDEGQTSESVYVWPRVVGLAHRRALAGKGWFPMAKKHEDDGDGRFFDRSWYNRAGVEYVMGFCTPEQHEKFLELCPISEKYMVDAGIILIKYWMEVGQKEQERRFEARIKDPLRQWKLSPMDLESFRRWYEYSRARDSMLEATDTKHAPWYIVRSDDKKRARLNCIAHLLSKIPYGKVPHEKVKLPKRKTKGSFDDQASLKGRHFVSEKY